MPSKPGFAFCSNLLQITGMSTPLRLSNELLVEAREAGARFHRSITQQVEHWAQIGRVIEATLTYSSAGKLKDLSRQPELNSVLAKAESREGKRKVLAAIKARKQAVYSADPDSHQGVIQHLPNGRKIRGRFVDRQFVPGKPA